MSFGLSLSTVVLRPPVQGSAAHILDENIRPLAQLFKRWSHLLRMDVHTGVQLVLGTVRPAKTTAMANRLSDNTLAKDAGAFVPVFSSDHMGKPTLDPSVEQGSHGVATPGSSSLITSAHLGQSMAQWEGPKMRVVKSTHRTPSSSLSFLNTAGGGRDFGRTLRRKASSSSSSGLHPS